MSDLWMIHYATLKHDELQKEAAKMQLVALAKRQEAQYRRNKQVHFGVLLYHLGKLIESLGSNLRKRFAPPLCDNCPNCAKPLAH
jgi:hypothetical protein